MNVKLSSMEGTIQIEGVGEVNVRWCSRRDDGDRGYLRLDGVDTEAQMQLVVDRLLGVRSNAVLLAEEGRLPASNRQERAQPKEKSPLDMTAAEIDKKFPVPDMPPSHPPEQDYASLQAFNRMESIREVIQELVKRGNDTLEKAQKAAREIQDSGVCPLLSRQRAALDDRVLATWTAMGLPS